MEIALLKKEISIMLLLSTTQSKFKIWILIDFECRFQGIETQERGAYMDLPTVGYSGHQSVYRKPVNQIEHRKDPFFNVNPMRPRLKDRDVRQTGEFQNLSAGF